MRYSGRALDVVLDFAEHRADLANGPFEVVARGILSKDTHGNVVRIAPPLNIPRDDLEWAIGEIRAVFREIEHDVKRAA